MRLVGFSIVFLSLVLMVLSLSMVSVPSPPQAMVIAASPDIISIQTVYPTIQIAPARVYPIQVDPKIPPPLAIIDIEDAQFVPNEIWVDSGTNITFRNHWSVHVIDIFYFDKRYIPVARSPKLAQGQEFSFIIKEPGQYTLRDVYFGWKGKIIVE